MGKPFSSELRILPSLYDWSLSVDISELVRAISKIETLSLLCAGSGGSYSGAHFLSQLHERYFGLIGKAVTPLELADANIAKNKAVVLLSAGGKNPDILGAFKSAILQDAKCIIVISFKRGTPLEALSTEFRGAEFVHFDIPSRGDGFLATNSLLAFCTLLLRAYCAAACSVEPPLPNLETLLGSNAELANDEALLRREAKTLWTRDTLVVLYGTAAMSTAIDIESKFTEAALGATQIADYRSFAHGRHHWLAKHGKSSAVLALITSEDRELANRTLRLIPGEIPRLLLDTTHAGPVASLALLISSFYLALSAGETRQIDPGRPGVPAFGSKIYRLNAFGKLRPSYVTSHAIEEAAISRKAGLSMKNLELKGKRTFWTHAFKAFKKRLESARFRKIVFDYDGTLCDEKDRYTGVGLQVAICLRKLLEENVSVGIATGRGKSVRSDLQQKLPQQFWPNVLIGYYNSSEIGSLDDNGVPNNADHVSDSLLPLADVLTRNKTVSQLANITLRSNQITIEPYATCETEDLWKILQNVVYSDSSGGCILVRSSHSFDVIPRYVSKRRLVEALRQEQLNSPVLCIGDMGNFPGNDYSLLLEPYSLSVEDVSPNPDTCWNLAPAGFRGVQAVEWYLNSLHFIGDGFKVKLP